MKKVTPKKLFVGVIAGGAIGVAILLAGTLLLAPGWHLIHGEDISYKGWKVPVPRDFFVTHSGETTTMWKVLPWQSLVHTSYAQIILRRGPERKPPFNYPRDYERFEQTVVRKIAYPNGYKLTGQLAVPAKGTAAFCCVLSRSGKQSEFWIWCAMQGSRLYVSYSGSPRNRAAFYSVLRGISRESVPSR